VVSASNQSSPHVSCGGCANMPCPAVQFLENEEGYGHGMGMVWACQGHDQT
jgi:hypothetical protein